MKEEWLLRGAVVPVDVETTAALVAEIKRLIDVVGGMALAQPERGPVVGTKTWFEDGKVVTQYITAKDIYKEPEQEPVAFINVEQRKLEWAKYMSWDTPTVVNLPKIPLYTTPPQRTWVGLMRGVRVEGDTVVISVKGGNNAARELCGELINEMTK